MSLILEHISPDKDDFPKVHTLLLKNEKGVKIGDAELMYFGKPFRFYYLFFIGVPSQHRGKGFGKLLLNQLNDFLDKRRCAGLLRNIISVESPTHAIYMKNEWNSVPGFTNWFVYNSRYAKNPQFDRAIQRIMSLEDDGKFYHQ